MPLSGVDRSCVSNSSRSPVPLGKTSQPALVNGPARIVISALAPGVLRPANRIQRRSRATCRCASTRRACPSLSIHHFINLGGAEFIVLRATPPDVQAGIRVGDAEYPAYPGTAVGLADPAVRVAFFALRHDQDRHHDDLCLRAR